MRVTSVYDCFPTSELLKVFRYVASYAIPFIGNVLFIPIISILLSVFLCDQTMGDDIDDAILSKDCYVQCWQGEHLIHLTVSAILLILYVPMAAYLRPVVQAMHIHLHVITRPQYLIVKTMFQLLLIILSKTLQRSHHLIHAFFYLFLVIIFAIVVILMRPYNYARFNLWNFLALCGNIWLSIITILALYESARNNDLIVAIFLGFIAIVIFGILFQTLKKNSHFPQYMTNPHSKHFEDKVRFMFCRMSNRQVTTVFNVTRVFHSSEDSLCHSVNASQYGAEEEKVCRPNPTVLVESYDNLGSIENEIQRVNSEKA